MYFIDKETWLMYFIDKETWLMYAICKRHDSCMCVNVLSVSCYLDIWREEKWELCRLRFCSERKRWVMSPIYVWAMSRRSWVMSVSCMASYVRDMTRVCYIQGTWLMYVMYKRHDSCMSYIRDMTHVCYIQETWLMHVIYKRHDWYMSYIRDMTHICHI